MQELTSTELDKINSRIYGEYCLKLPGVGPFQAFRMDEGLKTFPTLPKWISEMFTIGKIGFFTKVLPETVDRYWIKEGKDILTCTQGDWFVLLQDEGRQIQRYSEEMFKALFAAKEIHAPEGLDAPVPRTIEIYAPSKEQMEVVSQIDKYLEGTTDKWMSKAYYHYLEISRNLLETGPIPSRLSGISKYIEKLEEQGGQFVKAKYYTLLKDAFTLLEQ